MPRVDFATEIPQSRTRGEVLGGEVTRSAAWRTARSPPRSLRALVAGLACPSVASAVARSTPVSGRWPASECPQSRENALSKWKRESNESPDLHGQAATAP